MFIGHYGPAFGAKAAVRRVPLWVYFVAVQWLDVWWSIFVLTGVEHMRIQRGFMAASSLVLYDMPYTHGLFGALALSALLGAIVAWFFRAGRGAVFWVVALAAFSHWLLDLVVHAPDLWIYDGVKLGFGLWRWLWISLPLELVLLVAGAWIYRRAAPAKTSRGDTWLWLFVAAMAAVELYGAFGPGPTSPAGEAETALAAYGALALLAGLVDRTRTKV
ncbi:MAG: hypothetical protein ACREHE_06345 [Rhizomicrobium sp.]